MSARARVEPGLERAERLSAELSEREVDVLLVTTPVDVRYLTGFTGSSGVALMARGDRAGGAGRHRFFTDFRYRAQSAEQIPAAFEREIVAGDMLEAVAGALAQDRGRLGYDEAHLTVKAHRRLTELLADTWELVPAPGAVERLRAIKEPGEIARIRAAAELADEALRETLDAGILGRTER